LVGVSVMPLFSASTKEFVAAWHLLRNGEFHCDPGADYYTRRDPARTKARAVEQLETLGYTVTIQQADNHEHPDIHDRPALPWRTSTSPTRS